MPASREVLRKNRLTQRAAEVLAITCVFFLAAGGPPPGVNEPHYLCRLKHFWQPEWRPNDFFLNSPDAHFTVVWLAGWATRIAPLAAVAWAGRLLAWGSLAWAWQRLSWRVAPLKWGAVLSACLWMVGTKSTHLAGEWAVGGVESKCFAYVFVLLALHSMFAQNWTRVWPLLGAACALHALVGAWAGVVLLALWAGCYRQESNLRQMVPSALLAGMLALAGVLPALWMNANTSPEVMTEGNLIYVYERLPHHLALLSKHDAWIADRFSRHGLALVLLTLLTAWVYGGCFQSNNSIDCQTFDTLKRLHRFAWGAALISVMGLAISMALHDTPEAAAGLLRYYWHRLADIAVPLAIALSLIAWLHRLITASSRWAATAVGGLLFISGLFLSGQLSARLNTLGADQLDKQLRMTDWRAACQWAAMDTAPDATFLVPRNSTTFGWYAGRSEVVTWKNIPQNAAGLVEWHQRMHDIYVLGEVNGVPYSVRSLGRLGADRLQAIAQRYSAQYVLTTRSPAASLPIVYQNNSYVVYDLRVPPNHFQQHSNEPN